MSDSQSSNETDSAASSGEVTSSGHSPTGNDEGDENYPERTIERYPPINELIGDDTRWDVGLPLKWLRDNDYGARRHIDRAKLDGLKKSIESGGLINPLLVRPLSIDDDEWEVIAGTRRLRALREIYGTDCEEPFPCRVVDVDDHEARLLSIEENMTSESLAPLEQADGFAEAILVDYGIEAESDRQERAGVEEGSDGTHQTFSNYLPTAKGCHGHIRLPSQNHGSLKELADRAGVNPSTVRRRLRLLVLPESVQTQIEQEKLGLRIAERIAENLCDLPDPAVRSEQMQRLADDPNYTSPDDIDALDKRTAKIKQAYERRQADPGERIDALEKDVQKAEKVLDEAIGDAIDWYNQHDRTDEDLERDQRNTLVATARTVVEAYQDEIDYLDGECVARIEAERTTLNRDLERREETLSLAQKREVQQCLFCGVQRQHSALKADIEEFTDEIEDTHRYQQELEAVSDEFSTHRQQLRQALIYYEDAVDALENGKQSE